MPKEYHVRSTANMLLRQMDNGDVELCVHDFCFVAPWVEGNEFISTLLTNNMLEEPHGPEPDELDLGSHTGDSVAGIPADDGIRAEGQDGESVPQDSPEAAL